MYVFLKTKLKQLVLGMARKILKYCVPFRKSAAVVYVAQFPKQGIFYQDRPEVGCVNLAEKLKRVEEGGPFEWPNMIALNKSLQHFIEDGQKVAVIGSGTGTFEWHAKEAFPTCHFFSSEFDKDCHRWSKENRAHENITYTRLACSELLDEYGSFDVVVAVDVIEHVADVEAFIQDIARLAPRLVITTPNRDRLLETALAYQPGYYQHVREYDCGEIYWILKLASKRDVRLYSNLGLHSTSVEPVGFMSTCFNIIAVCDLSHSETATAKSC